MAGGRPLATRATNRRSKAPERVRLANTWLQSRATWKSVIFASARARAAKARKPRRSARVARINRASLAPGLVRAPAERGLFGLPGLRPAARSATRWALRHGTGRDHLVERVVCVM